MTTKFNNCADRRRNLELLQGALSSISATMEKVHYFANTADKKDHGNNLIRMELSAAILHLLDNSLRLLQEYGDFEDICKLVLALSKSLTTHAPDHIWEDLNEAMWAQAVDGVSWTQQISNMIGNYTDWPQVLEIMIENYENDHDELAQALAHAMGNHTSNYSSAMQQLGMKLIQLSETKKTNN